jgi:hypothetical protein
VRSENSAWLGGHLKQRLIDITVKRFPVDPKRDRRLVL